MRLQRSYGRKGELREGGSVRNKGDMFWMLAANLRFPMLVLAAALFRSGGLLACQEEGQLNCYGSAGNKQQKKMKMTMPVFTDNLGKMQFVVTTKKVIIPRTPAHPSHRSIKSRAALPELLYVYMLLKL